MNDLGWIVYPKIHVYLDIQNVTLFGSSNVIVWDEVIVNWWVLNPMTSVFIRRLYEDKDIKKWGCEMTELEIGAMNAFIIQELPKPRAMKREAWDRFSLRTTRRNQLCNSWFQIFSLKSCKRIYFCCFKSPSM